MKKKMTAKQFAYLLGICLLVSLLVNFNDVAQGFKDGWNGIVTVR